jgi:hypothetical protein
MRTCWRFSPETFVAVMPVGNDTEPLRWAFQLKRVQSCPAAAVLVATPVRDEPAELARPLETATRSAIKRTAADKSLVGTASYLPGEFIGKTRTKHFTARPRSSVAGCDSWRPVEDTVPART